VPQVGRLAAEDIVVLAATLHRLNTDHRDASVMFAATGLPDVMDVIIEAGVTHPDRLFVLEPIPLTLQVDEAKFAIIEPARRLGVLWEPAAVDAVVTAANAYPAHLQFHAHEVWLRAAGPDTITVAEAEAAIPQAVKVISRRTLDPRWNRMPGRQRELLAAVALLGGRGKAADISRVLDSPTKSWSGAREELLAAGDVYAPAWGELELTIPAFGPYALEHYASDSGNAKLQTLKQMQHNLGRTEAR
jgi:hypothetical protein